MTDEGPAPGEPAAGGDATPTTDDALLGGQVAYRQPARGYRVGLEAPLLAAFALPPGRRRPRAVVDLGAGPGAVALCLGWHLPSASLTLVERDPLHAALARHNVARNALGERARVHEGDASDCDQALGRGVADLVVSNPPWFDRGGGQPTAHGAIREAARGLSDDGFDPFCRSARQLLGRGGRFCLTAPPAALPALLASLARASLVPKRLRWLHPREGEAATGFFVEALAARPGGLVVEPPWFVRGAGEAYTDAMRALLWPERRLYGAGTPFYLRPWNMAAWGACLPSSASGKEAPSRFAPECSCGAPSLFEAKCPAGTESQHAGLAVDERRQARKLTRRGLPPR